MDVARFIDKSNMCGIFFEAVPGAPRLNCTSERMARAKRSAEEYLMAGNMLAVPQIYQHVKEVWECKRKLIAKQMELNALLEHGQELELARNEENSKLTAKLLQASLAIFARGNNIEEPDQIFHEVEGNDHRTQLNQITQM